MQSKLYGKKIVVLGVTAKHNACLEPLLVLLEKNGAEITRACYGTCSYELHKLGYKKLKNNSFTPFDAAICVEFWEAPAVPKEIPLISIAHGGTAPTRKAYVVENTHYFRNCDYYFTTAALRKEDFGRQCYIFSSRRSDHVCVVSLSSFAFGQMQQAYIQTPVKDCILFAMSAMRDRGKVDKRVYEFINYVLNETPYFCVFRPAPGDSRHPDIHLILDNFQSHPKFVHDTHSDPGFFMHRAQHCIGYKTSLSMLFSFISGKPNIEVDFTNTPKNDDHLRREDTGTGYFASNHDELARIFHAIDANPHQLRDSIAAHLARYDTVINADYEAEYINCFESILKGTPPENSILLDISPWPDINFTSCHEELMFFSTTLKNKTMKMYGPILDGRYACWDMAQSVWHHAASTGNTYLVYGFSLVSPNFIFPIKQQDTVKDLPFIIISQQNLPQLAKEYIKTHQQHCLGWWRLDQQPIENCIKTMDFMSLLALQPAYIIITGNSFAEKEACMVELYKKIATTLMTQS